MSRTRFIEHWGELKRVGWLFGLLLATSFVFGIAWRSAHSPWLSVIASAVDAAIVLVAVGLRYRKLLSLFQLRNGQELVRDVTETLAKWRLVPSDLEFDVTEATLAQITWTHNEVLPQLRPIWNDWEDRWWPKALPGAQRAEPGSRNAAARERVERPAGGDGQAVRP